MEDVLLKWAFRYPRDNVDESKNVLRQAEDIRLWARMKRFDDKHGTSFASRLDVEKPDEATPMSILEAEFLVRNARVSPLDTIRSLLDSFRKIEADTLLSQATHLRPMLEELCTLGQSFVQMIAAVQPEVKGDAATGGKKASKRSSHKKE